MIATTSTARPRDGIRLQTVLAATLRQWHQRRRQRAELRRLLAASPHLVIDIGITPEQAAFEADKPFWRA